MQSFFNGIFVYDSIQDGGGIIREGERLTFMHNTSVTGRMIGFSIKVG